MDYRALKRANRALSDREARSGATRLTSRPVFFWFDLNGPCNLKCAHCAFHRDGRTSEGEASEVVYDEILRELMPTAEHCHLGGTNYGEMTISRNFHRFLRDCQRFDVRVNLTTNGTRMNDEWIADLADAADVVGFSMEGMEGAFEAIRGFPWARFRANVEKFVGTVRDRGRSCRVEWRYCAHADSIRQLPDMIRLARAIGVDRIQVMPLVPFMREQRYKCLSYHRSLANDMFAEARAVAADLAFDIEVPGDFSTGIFSAALLKAKPGTRQAPAAAPTTPVELNHCYRPWQTCSINELGDVRACGIYWRPAGRIAQPGDFEAVWNGRKYRQLRRGINHRPDAICYNCRLPKFDSDAGMLAAELRPSPKQMAAEMWQSWRHPRALQFDGVLDADYDPHAVAARE